MTHYRKIVQYHVNLDLVDGGRSNSIFPLAHKSRVQMVELRGQGKPLLASVLSTIGLREVHSGMLSINAP